MDHIEMINLKDYAFDLRLEKYKEERKKKVYEEAKERNKLKSRNPKKSTPVSKKLVH